MKTYQLLSTPYLCIYRSMRKQIAAASAAVLLLVIAAPATAVPPTEVPQTGTTNYATYYTFHKRGALTMEGTGYQAIEEIVGITHNTDGKPLFDQMSVKCVGYIQEVKENWTWNGACIETDKDGDQVFTTYDMNVHYLVGGTGKYKGISGTAPYKVNAMKDVTPDTRAAIVDHEITWEFK